MAGALVASKLAPRGRDPSRRRPAVILERSEESRGGLLEDDNYRAELGSHSPLGDQIFFVGRGFTPAVLFSIAFFRREQAPALRLSAERANPRRKAST